MSPEPRRITFVTGTRAEWGLMTHSLARLRREPGVDLRVVATGMHVSPDHGSTLDAVRPDAVADWPQDTPRARATGLATAALADVFDRLDPHVVLVVGDRVEALASATAAHLQDRVVAHVHGGDRALGQADDAIRHAVSRLAHVHLPATQASADRLLRTGEDAWRIFRVGTPGLDGITQDAAALPGTPGDFALVVLHPTRDDDTAEAGTARRVLSAVLDGGPGHAVVVYPNNDPGWRGIAGVWDDASADPRVTAHRSLPRGAFLGLMRDAVMLVGNSSAGIIEAASFGLPVVDVAPRQDGRERSSNVTTCNEQHVAGVIASLWDDGRLRRWRGVNVYAAPEPAADGIARVLGSTPFDNRWRRKLIAY